MDSLKTSLKPLNKPIPEYIIRPQSAMGGDNILFSGIERKIIQIKVTRTPPYLAGADNQTK
jgi:hypothetical protein